MLNAEVSAERRDRDDHETKSVTIAFGGFILSVFFILWALIVLVRFYVFDNIFYNLFLFCLLTIGIVFNVASLNLLLTDVTETSYILPFIIGSPVSIFWTILCIFLPIFKKDFYSQFAFMPIALYDASFYDGLGHDPNNTSVHPFAKPFLPENSFFEKTYLILTIFVIAAMAQMALWIFSIIFHSNLKKELKRMGRIDAGCSKDL